MAKQQSFAIIRSVGGLVFDATFRESHKWSIELCENPIETGNEVADHMYVKADQFTLAAGVSNSPLHTRSTDQFVGRSRVQAACDLLRNLQRSGEPFDIQTGLLLYRNMMCLEVRAEQDKDTSEVLEFEADFREAIIVGTQTVTYPPRHGRTAHQGSSQVKKGQQQGKQVTTDSKKSSLLAKLANILHGNSQ